MSYIIEDGVTQSILSDWQACRVRARNRLDDWQRIGPSSGSLRYGSMWHALLEDYYKLLQGGSPADAEAVFAKFEPVWAERMAREEPDVVDETAEDLAIASALLPVYAAFWTGGRRGDDKKEWLAVESVFDVDFEGWRLRGRRDGLFKLGKEVWLLETKTKARVSEADLDDSLSFDFQNLFYILATEQETGLRCNGALYNIVRNPTIRPHKGEGLDRYVKRLRDDAEKRPEFYFLRYEVAYTRKRIEAFAGELVPRLREFGAWLRGEIPTYKSECACTGRYTCEFLGSCASDSMDGYARTGRMFSELEG